MADGKQGSTHDLDLFDRIQDEFDALLAGAELPELDTTNAANTQTATPLADTEPDLFDDKATGAAPFDDNAKAPASEADHSTAQPSEKTVDAATAESSTKIFLSTDDLIDTDDDEEPETENVAEPANKESKAPLFDEEAADPPPFDEAPETAAAEQETSTDSADTEPETPFFDDEPAETAPFDDDSETDADWQRTAAADMVQENVADQQAEMTEELSATDLATDTNRHTNASTDDQLDQRVSEALSHLDTAAGTPVDTQAAAAKPAANMPDYNPFEDDASRTAPDDTRVHADLSGRDSQGNGCYIMIAGALMLLVTGGMYWINSGSQQQADRAIPAQTAAKQETGQAVSEQSPATAVTHRPSQPGTTTENVAETAKAAAQRAAIERAKVARLAAKQKADKARSKRLAAEQAVTTRQPAATPPKQLAVIQPSTRLKHSHAAQSTTAANTAMQHGKWVINLASVNSDKSARQHIARMRAMGVESTSVTVNEHGRIFHRIRIGSFASKQAAEQHRDELAKRLGIPDAKVAQL